MPAKTKESPWYWTVSQVVWEFGDIDCLLPDKKYVVNTKELPSIQSHLVRFKPALFDCLKRTEINIKLCTDMSAVYCLSKYKIEVRD